MNRYDVVIVGAGPVGIFVSNRAQAPCTAAGAATDGG